MVVVEGAFISRAARSDRHCSAVEQKQRSLEKLVFLEARYAHNAKQAREQCKVLPTSHIGCKSFGLPSRSFWIYRLSNGWDRTPERLLFFTGVGKTAGFLQRWSSDCPFLLARCCDRQGRRGNASINPETGLIVNYRVCPMLSLFLLVVRPEAPPWLLSHFIYRVASLLFDKSGETRTWQADSHQQQLSSWFLLSFHFSDHIIVLRLISEILAFAQEVKRTHCARLCESRTILISDSVSPRFWSIMICIEKSIRASADSQRWEDCDNDLD